MIRGHSISLLGILFALITIFTGCSHKEPTQPNEVNEGKYFQKIAYVKWKPGQPPMINVADLYNNSGEFKLYHNKALVEGVTPCLSADQKWIAYILVHNGLTLREINVDGTDNTDIPVATPGISVQDVQISPDNSSLLVTVGNLHNLNVGIIHLQNGQFQKVYGDNGWSHTPAWSPDSKKIYFAWTDSWNRMEHNVPPLAKSYIVSINVDGTGLKFISDTVSGLSDDLYPDVSPDGAKIVFTSKRDYPNQIMPEVFIMDINGDNVHQLSKAIVSEKHDGHFDYYTIDDAPRWLSDNEHIIFQRKYWKWDNTINDYVYATNLCIINKNGTDMQNLTTSGESSLLKR